MHLLGRKRQQYLARTTELTEAREDQADCFLYSYVRIQTEAHLGMPDVADRNADAQLSTSGFGAGGIEHAGADYTELELADASLHTEQQAVVGSTRIVDAVRVDYPRPD